MFKRRFDWFKAFVVFVICLVALLFVGLVASLISANNPGKHEANAHKWAESMGIPDAKINCDPGTTCGCAVRYTDESKTDHIVPLACCGSGCEIMIPRR